MTRAALQSGKAELTPYADQLLAGKFRIEQYECEFRTVSEVMRAEGIEQLDLLKVDVEKSEEDVLAGIEAGDWARIGQIVMEVHGEQRLKRVKEILSGQGYEIRVGEEEFLKGAQLYNLYAVRRGLERETGRKRAQPRRLTIQKRPGQLAGALKEYLRDRLPDDMVPVTFVMMEKLPLTPSGKVDRKGLPAPERKSRIEGEAGQARTPVEELMAGIWQQVLKVEQVGEGR